MPSRANWRLVKRHRSYTVDEAARCLGKCKGTVRRLIKDGLPALDEQRPALILGADLIDFLKSRVRPKQKCKLDECYCFGCRTPKRPAFNEVEFHPFNAKSGNLRALCETCSTVMHKRVSQSKLSDLVKLLTVTIVENGDSNEQQTPPLVTGTDHSLNVHLKEG